jgi:DNA-binding IclR family transcriptional regulator
MKAPLQSVDRALEVLLSFDEHRSDWGVTELADEFGWDKSVAQRLLATLSYRGFLVSHGTTRRYRLGPAVWHLAWLWERKGGMAALARPVLTRLAQRTGYTAILAVPDGMHVRCVEAVHGDAGPLRPYSLVGELYPAHAGATSRAFFAMLPDQARANLFIDRPMARFSDSTPTDAAAVERSFQITRGTGYAYSEGEYDVATAALAVPLVIRGQPVATLTLLGSGTIPGDRHGDLVDLLRDGALELVRVLAPRPRPPR